MGDGRTVWPKGLFAQRQGLFLHRLGVVVLRGINQRSSLKVQSPRLVCPQFLIRSGTRCRELNSIGLGGGICGLAFYVEPIAAGCFCHDLDFLWGLGIRVDSILVDDLARCVKRSDACTEAARGDLDAYILAFSKFNLIAVLLTA